MEGATYSYVASSLPLELCVLYFLCAYWEKSAGHWSALPARSLGGPQDRNEPVARRGVVVVSRLSVVALFWVRKLTAWHFVVLIWDLAIAQRCARCVSFAPRCVYNNFVTYKICLYMDPFTDPRSRLIGPRVGPLRVWSMTIPPAAFVRVPLTQVYPMALPLPPFLPLNLSLALGWAWNNLNIFGFVFFFYCAGYFLRLAWFLILIFYHKVNWNSTVHDFLKILYKNPWIILKLICFPSTVSRSIRISYLNFGNKLLWLYFLSLESK